MLKIALVGQANVGKSTLFNRLIAESKAIVSPIPGTTRDCNSGICSWRGKKFIIIDTGGITKTKPLTEIEKGVSRQIIKAIKQADIIFFLIEIRPPFDSLTGLPISDFEREISRLIKKTKKPCYLILNKADNPQKRNWAKSFYWQNLGFGQPLAISSANGSGVGDLLDRVCRDFCQKKIKIENVNILSRIAIIGRPNVGKSTLLNALLKEEKAIVSSQPHTTREPQDTLIYFQKKPYLLIDTAGIRQKRKINSVLEKIGVEKSFKILARADIVLMILDASEQITHQDKALIDLIKKSGKGMIFIVNKCDLERAYQPELKAISWAPIIFISAKTGENIEKIFPLIEQVRKNQLTQFKQEELNEILKQTIIKEGWLKKYWGRAKIRQIKTRPIEFFLDIPKNLIGKKFFSPKHINILKKEIRKKWPLDGITFEIKMRR